MSQPAGPPGPLPRAGWYPDPYVPRLMRWWDGAAWSADTYERTIPLAGFDTPAPAGRPGAVAAQAQADRLGLPAVTTEDGAELASWGRRVAARLLDEVAIGLLGTVASLPWTASWWADAVRVWTSTVQSGQLGSAAAADRMSTQLASLAADPRLVAVTVAQVVVALVYDLVFLLRLGATPGKLALGLRVRPLAAGQRLTPGAVVRRWFGGWDCLGALPSIGWLYLLVDSALPLFDRRRQALHDKLAGTCVVRAHPAGQTSHAGPGSTGRTGRGAPRPPVG